MHCVDFFRSDLLKRYRQNTAENRPICSITALQYSAQNCRLVKNATLGYEFQRYNTGLILLGRRGSFREDLPPHYGWREQFRGQLRLDGGDLEAKGTCPPHYLKLEL